MTTETKKDKIVDVNKVYKTPDYVRRANRNYARKRYQEDPEYREKKNKLSHEYKQKNIEKTREYKRNYMREYRAKKKAEKAARVVESPDSNNLKDAMESLAIKN